MIINHNIPAMDTNRNLGINNIKTNKSLEKLSSGLRINRAGDDAAGLAISEKMRGQVRGLDMATKNANDGISLIQTAEGSMQSIENILQRMRELAVQAANDTYTEADRWQMQVESNALTYEINRIAEQTQFNTMSLLDGTFTGKFFHIGANTNQNISVTISAMKLSNIMITVTDTGGGSHNTVVIGPGGSYAPNPLSPPGGTFETYRSIANYNIFNIQTAIDSVSTARAELGAIQNRLEYSIENLEISSVNISAAESRIRDVDMAKEMMNFTKNNILVQAATAMLAQANQQPQSVLTLLR
jgi:flagellin